MAEDNGIKAYASLSADLNKSKGDVNQETTEGVVSDKLPELTLDMNDTDLVTLFDKYERVWKDSPKKQEWEKQIEENEKYWLGVHHDLAKLDKTRPMVDNLIFEALETYLPQTTRRNPEPITSLHSTEQDADGNDDPTKLKYVEKVKDRLVDLADDNKIRLKIKKGARHWAIFQLGVAKFGWDLDKDIPIVRIVRPKKIILDPDATIDEDGYTGNRIGEYRKLEAETLLGIIGDGAGTAEAKKAIEEKVGTEKGTEIQFVEWWTPQYLCWKMGKTILMKKKNPHWNYDRTEQPDPTQIASDAVSVDDYGNATAQPVDVKGINHFPVPKMPYVFLSVFNLGDQPMDKTSLIGQNLANQDKINKRNKQIDKNADKMNGGAVVSLARSGLSQAQAKNVVDAVRKGGAIIIPDGAPQDAVYFPDVKGLPNDVYQDLVDTRARLRDIFGTAGSSAAGLSDEQTVRGKIIARGTDTDRIGGGVSEYLEQFADDIYNWLYQLLLVYDAGFQFIGDARPPKVVISVKEGSLLPKDSTSIANQAIELGTANKMSLIDMYKRLEYPNAEELAANVWLETNAPQLLYKDNPLVQEAIGMQQEAARVAAEEKVKEGAVGHERDMEKEINKSLLKEVPIEKQV